MQLSLCRWVSINAQGAFANGKSLINLACGAPWVPDVLYEHLHYQYPKYHKMDILCKWTWLAAEILLTYDCNSIDPGKGEKMGLTLGTSHGSISVDRKFKESLEAIPSPSLFVYTLSNIMLGELSIRHHLKGEQMCFSGASMEDVPLYFWVNDMLLNRGMDYCVCGWADATEMITDIRLMLIQKNGSGTKFTPDTLKTFPVTDTRIS